MQCHERKRKEWVSKRLSRPRAKALGIQFQGGGDQQIQITKSSCDEERTFLPAKKLF